MSPSDHIALLLDARWFLAIELVATAAMATASAMLARREGYSLFGTLLLAGLAAVGGGVLRDLLVGRHPPATLARPDYLLTVIATVGACYATVRIHRMALARPGSPGRLRRLGLALARWMPSEEIVLVCDAAGLGAFTLVGVWVAFAYGCRPLWLWGPLLATMTTVGGGILRDIVRADHASAMLKTTLYAEISAIGGLAMTLCIQALGGPYHQWLLILLIGLLVLATATARVMAHFHRIPAPLFEPLPSAPSAVSDAAGPPRGLSISPGARRHRLWPAADGPAANQAANSNAGLVNPARVGYPDAAAPGAGRSPVRQLI